MNIFEKYSNSQFLNNLPVDSEFFPLRERIVDLFQFLDGLEDPHFEQGLDMDPHARLWEMMLAKILKSEGYEPTSSKRGPDFVVEKEGKKIFVEAVCPGTGAERNPNSVPPMVYGASIAQDVPVPQIVLRLCNALDEKKRKYVQYLEQAIVSRDDICIIAINSSKIGARASGLWSPVIMRATHGLGDPFVTFARGEEATTKGILSCTSIPKVGGQEIATTFLLAEENSLISAVLYSDCSYFSLGYDLFKESIFIHNPKAQVSLRPGFLQRIPEIWTICCLGSPQWRAYRINNPSCGPGTDR